MGCLVTSCTNQIVFLLSVREHESIKKRKIARINIREKGGVRNVK